ncbi:MAG: DUF512 domain-containing protein [Candidatus Flemingibacterium sp.]|nr:DUF512 domain-containing protein [Candidatus Flemingibacterium sp.]
MVTITGVEKASPAAKHGILPGDILISINGHDINDVLDYRFRLTEKKITLLIHRGPDLKEITIKKDEYSDIGLEFETYLMDKKHSCRNKCVFCFIDQLPKGMRDTLYFKDDDSRLSFLMGNYITLTNLSEEDVDRIIEMKTSPINVSVHTTNPELRVKMMKNKNAGKVLSYLRRFADAGISLNCQIVLCKGINDGKELERSMTDLAALYPSLVGVSIVPAGITNYREGLCHLEPFTAEEAGEVIDTIDKFGEKCLKKFGTRLFFSSDELYIEAGRELPGEDYYEGYPQIENGVGMIRSMDGEFTDELDFLDEYDLEKPRKVSVATGAAAYDFIKSLADRLCEQVPTLECHVYKIINDFFGHNITVAGLLTGKDLANQLKGKDLGDRLLIPRVTLRSEGDVFLDDTTPEWLAEQLGGVEIVSVESTGNDFVSKVLF